MMTFGSNLDHLVNGPSQTKTSSQVSLSKVWVICVLFQSQYCTFLFLILFLSMGQYLCSIHCASTIYGQGPLPSLSHVTPLKCTRLGYRHVLSYIQT